jgi:hypothetical protein
MLRGEEVGLQAGHHVEPKERSMSNIEPNDPLQAVRAQVEKAVIAKAMEEDDFRALLKADPHAALAKLLGQEVPLPTLKINVVEEQAGEVTIVLPAPLVRDELPDELLDLASGGSPERFYRDPETGTLKIKR